MSQHIYFHYFIDHFMAEEVNRGNSDFGSNPSNMVEDKILNRFISILITVSLVVGPILLPFVLIKPNWFSAFPYLKEISISITFLFVLASTVVAYLRDKKTENESS
ncbi:MAG: hypothetical protein GPJ54_03145 [Candidatus Heimdallarchaeota archaeon]|nr:hypothetical protein [Candidatus Heimdallarchaeota archaeon]